MNQQRARRFSTAKDATEGLSSKEARLNIVRETIKDSLEGYDVSSWDHNVITPGTIFMEKVSEAIKFYILKKINSNPKWKNLKVIFSDAHWPGEGEHKLFHYIRTQTCEGLTHLVHGLDADLIMLSILSHEKKIFLMRENQFDIHTTSLEKPLYSFSISYLIECLSSEFEGLIKNGNETESDIQNMIDDFILLCCFVGNDFLPRLPSLIISDGALDVLIQLYKEFVIKNGFITKGTQIKLKKLILFLNILGDVEDKLFPKKVEQMSNLAIRNIEREKKLKILKEEGKIETPKEPKQFKAEMLTLSNDRAKMLEFINRKSSRKELAVFETKLYPESIIKQTGDWKKDFYEFKFFDGEKKSEEEILNLRKELVLSYIEGLIFVWKYYTINVQSWDWYYPFHYTPLSSDILQFSDDIIEKFKNFKFEYNFPFKPFDQLMSVMPKRSSHCLPSTYRNEMLSENSNLKEFYPSNFEQDLNLTNKSWKSVVLLPFIDSTKLINITRKLKVTKEEKSRNAFKYSILFFHKDNLNFFKIYEQLKTEDSNEFNFFKFKSMDAWLKFDKDLIQIGEDIKSPVNFHKKFSDIKDNQCVGLFFINPCSKEDFSKNDFVTGVQSIESIEAITEEEEEEKEEKKPKKKQIKKVDKTKLKSVEGIVKKKKVIKEEQQQHETIKKEKKRKLNNLKNNEKNIKKKTKIIH